MLGRADYLRRLDRTLASEHFLEDRSNGLLAVATGGLALEGRPMFAWWDDRFAVEAHYDFSEKLFIILLPAVAIARLAGGPAMWVMVWFLPALATLVGKIAYDSSREPGEYWWPALGSQLMIAVLLFAGALIRLAS